MNTQDLQDEELVTLAHKWRQRALRGDKNARGIAHELESAVRHRCFLLTSLRGVVKPKDLRQDGRAQ